jgi:hypothetical protein
MIQMMAKRNPTEDDIKAWSDFTRKRDLSPSITNQVVFARQHPGDKTDYTVTVKSGTDVMVDVFSK